MLLDANGKEVKQPTLMEQLQELAADMADLSLRHAKAGERSGVPHVAHRYAGGAAMAEMCAGKLQSLIDENK